MTERAAIGSDEALLRIDLPPTAESVHDARERAAALEQLSPERQGDVRLIVSELATNAIRHSGIRPSDIYRLTIARHGQRLRIDLDDGGSFTASPFERPFSASPRGGWVCTSSKRSPSTGTPTRARSASGSTPETTSCPSSVAGADEQPHRRPPGPVRRRVARGVASPCARVAAARSVDRPRHRAAHRLGG